MRIYSPKEPFVDGDILGREGALEGLVGSLCYRCGRPPETAHDRFFCPSFSSYADAGVWLSFSKLLKVIKKHAWGKSLIVLDSNNVEELEGPENTWHKVVGIYVDGKFLARFDSPRVPEFSIWKDSTRVWDFEHGSIAARSSHPMFYKGWRCGLKPVREGLNLNWPKFCKDLGIPPDRSTEEIARRKSGWG